MAEKPNDEVQKSAEGYSCRALLFFIVKVKWAIGACVEWRVVTLG